MTKVRTLIDEEAKNLNKSDIFSAVNVSARCAAYGNVLGEIAKLQQSINE